MSTTKPAFDDLGFSPILGASVTYQQGERARAVRYVAGGSKNLPGSGARDAADLTRLLEALDLDPKEGRK